MEVHTQHTKAEQLDQCALQCELEGQLKSEHIQRTPGIAWDDAKLQSNMSGE